MNYKSKYCSVLAYEKSWPGFKKGLLFTMLLVLVASGCVVKVKSPIRVILEEDSSNRRSHLCTADEASFMDTVEGLTWTVTGINENGSGHYALGNRFYFRFCEPALPNIVKFDSGQSKNSDGYVHYPMISYPLYYIDASKNEGIAQFCFVDPKENHEHFASFTFYLNANAWFEFDIRDLRDEPCPTEIMVPFVSAHGNGTGTGR